MIILLALPVVAGLILALLLLTPWFGLGGLPASGPGPVTDGPNQPPPATRGVTLGTPSPLPVSASALAVNPHSRGVYVLDPAISTSGSSSIAVLDSTSLAVRGRFPIPSLPYDLYLSPAGTLYSVRTGLVEIISSDGAMLGQVTLPDNGFFNIGKLGTDGQRLVLVNAVGGTRTALVIDTATRSLHQFSLPSSVSVSDIALSPDGSSAYLTRTLDTAMRLDLTTGRISDIPAALHANNLAASVDGTVVYAASADLISTLDARTGQLIRRVAVPGFTGAMCALPGGQLAVVDGVKNTLKVINPGTGDVLATTPVAGYLGSDGLTTDGRRLFLRRVSGVDVITVTER